MDRLRPELRGPRGNAELAERFRGVQVRSERGGEQMSTAVALGMPAVPPPRLGTRRVSRQVNVGGVLVGGGEQVSVQSMTTTVTADINSTLQQIAALTASGCQIVRVAVPSQDDADALPAIARKSQIPVIADIHFQPKYVFAAIDAGCAAVRVNPGNMDQRLLAKYGRATAEALVESALWECSLFEEHGFRDLKISVKHHDPVVMVQAYQQLAERCDYPLHLGVTEAGPAFQGTVKSSVAFGALLAQGIGDTIRVSLSAPPVEEVKVGIAILESLNLRQRGLEIVSCPSCGRAQVDVYTLAEEVSAGLDGLDVPLRVAVMGCVVNGPGEAREADLGVASGNGKGQIFVRGKVVRTVPEHQIVETLIDEALRLAELRLADKNREEVG
jgi:(E)-4-hydroxy-3-methylbut-2-enyl-diphosphate synthase